MYSLQSSLPRNVSRSLRSIADPRLSIKSRFEKPPLLQYSDKNLLSSKKYISGNNCVYVKGSLGLSLTVSKLSFASAFKNPV